MKRSGFNPGGIGAGIAIGVAIGIATVKVVAGMDEAMEHIAKYGSQHTEAILTEKGLVDPKTLDALIDTYEHKVGPRNGARVVARANRAAEETPPVSAPRALLCSRSTQVQ